MDKDFLHLPGGDLVLQGLRDLDANLLSEPALLVLIAGPRLRRLGVRVPEGPTLPIPYEHALFDLIENRLPSGAHMAYNALLNRIVSFAQSYGQLAPVAPGASRPPE